MRIDQSLHQERRERVEGHGKGVPNVAVQYPLHRSSQSQLSDSKFGVAELGNIVTTDFKHGSKFFALKSGPILIHRRRSFSSAPLALEVEPFLRFLLQIVCFIVLDYDKKACIIFWLVLLTDGYVSLSVSQVIRQTQLF
ncbi:hypothetical protein BDA96_01G160100 [Sorghum bicolor]|uniref:Uncharacterized protein n=2 Tax=Sorghum bicolor TaxID=4558 RepID=A0A921RZ21_SORBI|nr:hypothetical protein BDA96_01G160100 [Sorghum bicolor]OQU91260.1 hypothetical protein SORBI_3001G152320 [Sorghum bicolor]